MLFSVVVFQSVLQKTRARAGGLRAKMKNRNKFSPARRRLLLFFHGLKKSDFVFQHKNQESMLILAGNGNNGGLVLLFLAGNLCFGVVVPETDFFFIEKLRMFSFSRLCFCNAPGNSEIRITDECQRIDFHSG